MPQLPPGGEICDELSDIHRSSFTRFTQGHMASDCPEPEVCRRCRKEGHVKVFNEFTFVLASMVGWDRFC